MSSITSPLQWKDLEEMALSNADRDWIRDQIKGRGWGRVATWLKEWGIPSIIGGLIVVAIFEWNHFTTDYAAFRQHTEDRLHTLETKLNVEAALRSSPSAALTELSRLDQRDFPAYVPALRKVIESPTGQANLNTDVLQKIRVHLLVTNNATPEYWPTTLEFIGFASSQLAPPDLPPSNLTLYVDNLVFHGVFPSAPKGTTIILNSGEIENHTFEDYRIVFTVNPVRMKNVRFINCLITIPVTDDPTPYLKEAAQALLASNLSSVTIRSL